MTQTVTHRCRFGLTVCEPMLQFGVPRRQAAATFALSRTGQLVVGGSPPIGWDAPKNPNSRGPEKTEKSWFQSAFLSSRLNSCIVGSHWATPVGLKRRGVLVLFRKLASFRGIPGAFLIVQALMLCSSFHAAAPPYLCDVTVMEGVARVKPCSHLRDERR
jgi:hypothetical protein